MVRQYGYHGKILHVDLTHRTLSIEAPDEKFWRVYGGGGLLATYYLMRHCPPRIDAFNPRNLLIFSSSVVAGHPYAGLSRFTAASKSPLTGGVGEARCEGPFGHSLKGSGVDAIIISGESLHPVYLVAENGAATFRDAESLWGRTVSETVDLLESEFGSDIGTAVIGPAGENRVRFASIVTNRTHQVARMGMGAVMGSKRLKALVIRGDRHPPVADPERCARLSESYRTRMFKNPLTRWQLEPPGFSAWVHVHGTDAALCTRNYRDSVFEGAAVYRPDQFMKHYQGDGVCPGCPNNCIKIFGSRSSKDRGVAGGIHQEITGALGSNLGMTDLDFVLEANIQCNELGLDPTSLGFTLSMAMECVERGILDESKIGLQLRFGDSEAVLRMIGFIAQRAGFGAILAEGAKRAAEVIGKDSAPFALHVKGLEMVPFEPRTQTNLALGYAVAPTGPRYDVCEHDWDYDVNVGWPHTLDNSRTLGILERIPMQQISPDKVRNFKALNTLWSGADALDLCLFAVAPTRVLTLAEMAELLSAVTGWSTSSYEIMRYGERRNHLMRVYNIREGIDADQDTLPDRFFDEPLPQGALAGTKLDRVAFAAAIKTYYLMMGWDELGRPRPETLIDHHLVD